jgi:endo-1,4-beta-xylanase
MMRRRDVLGGLALAGLTGSAFAASAEPARGESLNELARARGLRFGSAIAAGPGGGSIDTPAYADLVAAECGLVVPEGEMKWRALQPEPGGPYRFERADRLVAWAKSRGLQVRGHNLIWLQTQWLPDWVNGHDFGSRPATAAEKLIAEHVRTVCARYGATIASWDVINEAIDPETGELFPSVLTKILGPRALDIAFHAAREALPNCRLVYNDFMSWTADSEKHRTAVLKLLERFKREGVPVDSLGLQSHLGQGGRKPVGAQQPGEWRRFLEAATGMGYGLLATELDVGDKTFPTDIAQRDAGVAALARDYLDITLSFPQTSDLLCWGMVDRFSWLQKFTPRPDNLPQRPCPYDADYRPKPMREAIAGALRTAPARTA